MDSASFTLKASASANTSSSYEGGLYNKFLSFLLPVLASSQ